MKNCMVGVAGAVLAGVIAAGVGGCADVQSTPMLPADAFVTHQPVVGSGEPVDRPGPLIYDSQHRPLKPITADPHISDTVRESVRPPTEAATQASNGSDVSPPAPAPSTTAAASSDPQGALGAGQWQEVGSVLAIVNEEPIYAHKVVSTLERPLASEARSRDEKHFRAFAEEMVAKQIREFIDNDLEYAAAKKSLEKADEQIAKFVTAEWRKDQVRKAGGSEAMARQRSAEDGVDFEESVQEQYRLNLTRLYYQKKIIPLIQVSAADMREYYQANIREYQTPAATKFRLLWISTAATGGRDQAFEKARLAATRARTGEDFGELATKLNDDSGLKDRNGVVGDAKGWMEKGAYVSEKVEQAVWQLKPGEVSNPIDAPHKGEDGFFVAKLEEIQPGRSDSFENEKVQDNIREALRRDQFAKLRETHRRALIQQAVIYENPNMHDSAMDMVMQRYPVWVAAK